MEFAKIAQNTPTRNQTQSKEHVVSSPNYISNALFRSDSYIQCPIPYWFIYTMLYFIVVHIYNA